MCRLTLCCYTGTWDDIWYASDARPDAHARRGHKQQCSPPASSPSLPRASAPTPSPPTAANRSALLARPWAIKRSGNGKAKRSTGVKCANGHTSPAGTHFCVFPQCELPTGVKTRKRQCKQSVAAAGPKCDHKTKPTRNPESKLKSRKSKRKRKSEPGSSILG